MAIGKDKGVGRRSIKLFCQSVSKIVQIIEWENKKVDFGFIAGAFGLDPFTVKLNGHFVSRGVDFIASSVTWKSLIDFFSARGFPTGAAADSNAILVQGKLSRSSSKREHDLVNADEFLGQSYIRNHKKPQLEHHSMLNDVAKEAESDVHVRISSFNGQLKCLGLKRNLLFEDNIIPLKISRTDTVPDLPEGNCNTSTDRRFPCSFICNDMKRMRDDEMLVGTPFKKMR